MPPSQNIHNMKKELVALASGLPFRVIECPEFSEKDYAPERIRQPRTWVTVTHSMQIVSRFLAERGTVDILKPEYTLSLFTEMHHAGWTIQALSKKRPRSEKKWRELVVQARREVSNMEAAEEELFIANRRLIVSCIRPFSWIGPAWLPDFLQEGSRALSNAIRKFDFTRGTPFYAYAQISIQNRLRNYFRDHVRAGNIGVSPTQEMQQVQEAIATYRDQHEEAPDLETLAEMVGFSEDRTRKLLTFVKQYENAPGTPVSLDAEIGDSQTNLYSFIVGVEAESATLKAQQSELWAAVNTLPERSARILWLRFKQGYTLEETGQSLNLTRARIKQIQDDALRKLRQNLQYGVKSPHM